MRLVYFAWIRERIGIGSEEVDLPSEVRTAGQLLDWLASRGQDYAAALEQRKVIRVAIDQEHAMPDDEIGHAKEIALFPPMTGG